MSDAAAGPADEATGAGSGESALPTAPEKADRAVERAADRIRSFATAHPDARATISYLGRDSARVVLVSESGAWGDVVVRGMEQAEQACERAAVTVIEWDRETAAQVDLSPAYRIRMAGTGR